MSALTNIRDVIEISCLSFMFSVKMGFGVYVKEVFLVYSVKGEG